MTQLKHSGKNEGHIILMNRYGKNYNLVYSSDMMYSVQINRGFKDCWNEWS